MNSSTFASETLQKSAKNGKQIKTPRNNHTCVHLWCYFMAPERFSSHWSNETLQPNNKNCLYLQGHFFGWCTLFCLLEQFSTKYRHWLNNSRECWYLHRIVTRVVLLIKVINKPHCKILETFCKCRRVVVIFLGLNCEEPLAESMDIQHLKYSMNSQHMHEIEVPECWCIFLSCQGSRGWWQIFPPLWAVNSCELISGFPF